MVVKRAAAAAAAEGFVPSSALIAVDVFGPCRAAGQPFQERGVVETFFCWHRHVEWKPLEPNQTG